MPAFPLLLHSRGLASPVGSYYDNFKEAMIHGLVAVRGVLLAISSLKHEELNIAARNIKRQARIAAHYAIAYLGQGGKAPQPMSREAKENVIRLVLARVDRTPRSLKSLPGGAIHGSPILLCARVRSPELFQAKLRTLVAGSVLAARSAISSLDSGGRPLRAPSSREISALRAKLEALAIVSLGAMVPEGEAIGLEVAGELGEVADAVGSIVRGALLFRDCIRKNRLFHATGQRAAETTSIETTKRWA